MYKFTATSPWVIKPTSRRTVWQVLNGAVVLVGDRSRSQSKYELHLIWLNIHEYASRTQIKHYTDYGEDAPRART